MCVWVNLCVSVCVMGFSVCVWAQAAALYVVRQPGMCVCVCVYVYV